MIDVFKSNHTWLTSITLPPVVGGVEGATMIKNTKNLKLHIDVNIQIPQVSNEQIKCTSTDGYSHHFTNLKACKLKKG